MAGKNTVTLTLAGDSAKLEQAFDRVGASAKDMSSDVGRASRGFDSVGEAADNSERRILGVKDSVDGVATIMAGPGEQGIAAYIQGWADLSSGVANFLIPAAKAILTTGVATVKMKLAAGAAKTWAAGQWLLNAALTANPIGLVIAAIALLAAGFVIAWKRSERFREVVTGAFHGIRVVVSAAVDWIVSRWTAGIKALRNAWNSTIGGRGITIPDIPGLPGRGQRFEIPRLHHGGIVPGAPGSQTVALLQAGERVSPAGAGPRTVIEIRSGGSRLDDLLVEVLRRSIRAQGGNVQTVLGRA